MEKHIEDGSCRELAAPNMDRLLTRRESSIVHIQCCHALLKSEPPLKESRVEHTKCRDNEVVVDGAVNEKKMYGGQ